MPALNPRAPVNGDKHNGQRTRRLLGAATLLGLCGLIVLIYIHPNPFADSASVKAVFPNAVGISNVGRDVRIAGVNVGTIASTERTGDHALITMTLQGKYARLLREDATAALRPRFAFEGTAFIELNPGTAAAPPLGSATIPLSHTSTYVSFDQARRFATPATRQQIQGDVADTKQLLGAPVQGALQHVLGRAPSLTRDMAIGARAATGPSGTELAGVVRGAAQTMSAVAHERDNLAPLLQGAQRTFAAFETQSGTALDATVRALPGALESLNTGGRSLVGILDHLDPLARDLQPGLGALAPTIDSTRPLLLRAAPSLRSARPLVSSLRGVLAAGAASSPSAGSLLSSLDSTDAVLNSSLLPALQADTPLHVPAYLTLLNLFEGGAGAFSPFQTDASGPPPGHFGNGHFVRFDGHFYSGVGLPVPPCTLLDRVSPTLGNQLATIGLCVR